MFHFQRVLFPVDFSHQCGAMLPYIADLANRFRADLNFLHVVEDGEDLEKLRRERSLELAAFAARIPAGRYCPQMVAYGKPGQAVARYAKTCGIDIVALPAKDRWAQDSVIEDVLRQVSCAVWTGSAAGNPHTRWSPVVCAVDLESGSEQVISYASALADAFHANLIVVHAVSDVAESSWRRSSRLPAASSRRGGQRKLEKLLQDLNVSAEPVVQTGSVEDVVGFVTEHTRAELLVVGRGTQARAEGSLGAHAYGLVTSSQCPVVSCPRQPASVDCFWTEWQQEQVSGVAC